MPWSTRTTAVVPFVVACYQITQYTWSTYRTPPRTGFQASSGRSLEYPGQHFPLLQGDVSAAKRKASTLLFVSTRFVWPIRQIPQQAVFPIHKGPRNPNQSMTAAPPPTPIAPTRVGGVPATMPAPFANGEKQTPAHIVPYLLFGGREGEKRVVSTAEDGPRFPSKVSAAHGSADSNAACIRASTRGKRRSLLGLHHPRSRTAASPAFRGRSLLGCKLSKLQSFGDRQVRATGHDRNRRRAAWYIRQEARKGRDPCSKRGGKVVVTPRLTRNRSQKM